MDIDQEDVIKIKEEVQIITIRTTEEEEEEDISKTMVDQDNQ